MSDVKGHMSTPLILLAQLVILAAGHPQCLDFRAPFQPATTLSLCSGYSALGCCSSSDDDKIREEFEFIRSRVTDDEWKSCHGYIKEILCQKCSPYAAHIYDAEGTSKARQFPGLCTTYCHDFYDKCKIIIWLLHPNADASIDKHRFCEQVAITDKVYCYPDLLTSPLILRNLTASHNLPSDAKTNCLCLETVGDNLANPLWARHAGDGSHRLFVAEQQGRVRIYNTKTKKWRKRCFINFSHKIMVTRSPGDERGFLGMAFHPSYSTNGRFFMYYVTGRKPGDVLPRELSGHYFPFTTKVVISEGRVSKWNANRADRKYERVLLEVMQPYDNHNGGELMFGLDGYLYAFIGDGGGAGDPMNAGQNKSLLHGKVLRLDVDSDPTKAYTIPPDNPFVGETGSRPEIFAYGIRNIWRCGLDRGGTSRGRILCGDVGQNAYEEIDIIKKGANYGWNSREGFECYDTLSCGRIGPEELPVHAYSHRFGQSVTGGVFYRGCENPALQGQYIYADYASSRMFSLMESKGKWTNENILLCGSSLCQGNLVGHSYEYILSFGEDEDGEIYMLTSQSSSSKTCDGKISKIIDPIRRNDPSWCSSDIAQKRLALPKRDPVKETDKEQSHAPDIVVPIKISTDKHGSRDSSSTLRHSMNTYHANHQQSQHIPFLASSLSPSSSQPHSNRTNSPYLTNSRLYADVGEKHQRRFTSVSMVTQSSTVLVNQAELPTGKRKLRNSQAATGKRQKRIPPAGKARGQINRKQNWTTKKLTCGVC